MEPELTPDGRYVVIDGRRWRATDPAVPESLRDELVCELMAARRAVGAALRADDADATHSARARVNDAKVALGERGKPWWEPSTAGRANRRAAAGRALTRARRDSGVAAAELDSIVGNG